MKLKVTGSIRLLSGEDAKDENGKPFTVRHFMCEALITPERVDAQEKLSRWKLAKLIHETDEPDITIEQLALVKSAVGATCSPTIVGRIEELINERIG